MGRAAIKAPTERPIRLEGVEPTLFTREVNCAIGPDHGRRAIHLAGKGRARPFATIGIEEQNLAIEGDDERPAIREVNGRGGWRVI